MALEKSTACAGHKVQFMSMRGLVFAFALAVAACGGYWLIIGPPRYAAPVETGSVFLEPASAYQHVFDETGAIEYELVLRNRSSRVVHIRDAIPSCSCTVASVSSSAVAPGDNATVHVVYNVVSLRGELPKRRVVIRTDDPNAPELICTLGGFREQRFVVDPASISFGDRIVGEAASVDVTIQSNGEDNELLFEKAMFTNPFLSVNLMEAEQMDAGLRYHARVSLSECAPIGEIAAKMFVPRRKDDGIGPHVWVRGNVSGPVRAIPKAVYFGPMRQGEGPVVVNVQLEPLHESHADLADIGCVDNICAVQLPAGITADISADDPNVRLTADPTAIAVGEFSKSVILSCLYNGKRHQIDINVRGIKVDRPQD